MLGIIGAMDIEVEKIIDMMGNVNIVKKGVNSFYQGKINDKEVVIVKCGVGKVNSAMCTQLMIDTFPIKAIVNTGIAGSLDAKINIGDIVIGEDAIEHDMNVAALGYGPGIIPDFEQSIFEADKEMMEIAKKVMDTINLDVHVYAGRVLSGDQFISDSEKKKWLVETFSGRCTEMEGAAMAHVAYANHIPFLIIRAISDKADNSAEMDYPTFAAKAVDNSVKFMDKFIEEF